MFLFRKRSPSHARRAMRLCDEVQASSLTEAPRLQSGPAPTAGLRSFRPALSRLGRPRCAASAQGCDAATRMLLRSGADPDTGSHRGPLYVLLQAAAAGAAMLLGYALGRSSMCRVAARGLLRALLLRGAAEAAWITGQGASILLRGRCARRCRCRRRRRRSRRGSGDGALRHSLPALALFDTTACARSARRNLRAPALVRCHLPEPGCGLRPRQAGGAIGGTHRTRAQPAGAAARLLHQGQRLQLGPLRQRGVGHAAPPGAARPSRYY